MSKADEFFTCVICQHEISLRWNTSFQHKQLPPICRYCESEYAKGTGKPSAGSFRDRREVIRGFVMAEALYAAAARIRWSTSHVRS